MLLVGGEWLVRGAVDLALRLKISVLVVGMTVVSFATSAPELLVSVGAALNGYTDISFGNVVGSNLANIALILGVTVCIFPMVVSEKTYKVDYWIMMVATFLLFGFVYFDSLLSFNEAVILVVALVAYNTFMILSSKKDSKAEKEQLEALGEPEVKSSPKKVFMMVAFLLAGIASLKYGAQFLIEGAVTIAKTWGVSERVIGITVVSIGTSLPELAASLVASFKGEQELSLGNLIGSNIFNILAVLGITGMLIDLPVKSPELLTFDFPYLIGACLVLLLFIVGIGRGKLSRWQGAVMLSIYALYLYFVLK